MNLRIPPKTYHQISHQQNLGIGLRSLGPHRSPPPKGLLDLFKAKVIHFPSGSTHLTFQKLAALRPSGYSLDVYHGFEMEDLWSFWWYEHLYNICIHIYLYVYSESIHRYGCCVTVHVYVQMSTYMYYTKCDMYVQKSHMYFTNRYTYICVYKYDICIQTTIQGVHISHLHFDVSSTLTHGVFP